MKNQKGFSLIELLVVIAIISILSGIILFSTRQYINNGKDSNISGGLSTLIPGGEVWYNAESASYGDGYNGFCNPVQNSAIRNIIAQMPVNPGSQTGCYNYNLDQTTWTNTSNPAGLCCKVEPNNYQSWVACVQRFGNSQMAYCVDSRGVRKEIPVSQCTGSMTTYHCQ